MSSATQFVDELEKQGLLEAKVLAGLRKQLAEKQGRVTSQAIAKLLVSKGHLTKFQASKLVEKVDGTNGDGQAVKSADENKPVEQKSPPAPAEEELGLAPSAEELAAAPSDDDELGLALTEEEQQAAATAARKPALEPDEEIVEMEEAVEMEVIDDDQPLEPLDDGGLMPLDDGGLEPLDDGGLQPLDDGELEPLDDGGLEPLGGFDGGLEPLDDGMAPTHGGLTSLDDSLGPLDGGLAPLNSGPGGAATATSAARSAATPQAVAEAEEIRKRLAAKNKNVWDSKWLLIGSTAFLLLVFVGVLLWYNITKGSEAEFFAVAEQDYRSQSYSSAIQKYEQYLSKWPKGSQVSKARVRIGMGKLRIAVEQSSDAEAALNTAKEVLPGIENEKEMNEARGELAALLPQIAERLVARADKAGPTSEKQRGVELVGETMRLIENPNYIPRSLLQSQDQRIKRIREDRARVERDINRSRALAASLKEVDGAVAARNTTLAYESRTALLKRYPELESHEQLREATLRISDAQRELVQVAADSIAPESGEVAGRSEMQVVLASGRGNGNAGLTGQMVYVLVDGAVYGLRGHDGQVAWRRYVGNQRTIQPQSVSSEPGADALLADVVRHELVRVAATTGQPVWRLPIGEPFQSPRIAGKQIFVTTDAGRVLSVDLETGESHSQARLPQPAKVSATFDTRRPYLYQVADQSNLYVLAKDSLRSSEVFHLGHLPGTISAPPVMSLGHLFIVENAGPGYSVLHILATDTNGLKLKRPQEPIRLQGHVHVQPFLAGRHVIVVTDTGGLYVYDVETTTPSRPVTEVLKEVPKSFDKFLTYPFVESTALWLAGRSLTSYEMQFSSGKLRTNWIEFVSDTFVAPPQRFNEILVTVRRPANAPGYTVTALHGADKTLAWETDLGVPAGQICVDTPSRKITSISSRGALYEINSQTLRDGFAKPTQQVGVGTRPLALTAGIELGEGKWGLVDPNAPGKVAVYDTRRSTRPLRLVTADISAKASTRPVAFAGGVIVPLDNGQIAHVDLSDGKHAHPFQPPVQPNKVSIWRRPAVIADGREFVAADDRLKLYRVGVSDQGQRHLRLLADVDLTAEIVSPLAAIESTLYGVIRGGSGDVVISYKLPDLKPGKEWNLDGRVVWGPERVGDSVLLISDSEGLMCFEADENQKWAKPIDHDALAGSPVLDDGGLLFASVSGEVWRVDPATGDELGKSSLGEPLASGPVPYGTRLLLSGTDGVLHVILKPVAEPALSAN